VTGSVSTVMMEMAWGVCGRAKEWTRIVVESQAIRKGSESGLLHLYMHSCQN